MKFELWTTAYGLLNKRLQKVYPKFQELHVQLKRGGVLIAFQAYIAFMVLMSIIALVIAIPVTFIILPFLIGIPHLSSHKSSS
jgi:hypothetical protein